MAGDGDGDLYLGLIQEELSCVENRRIRNNREVDHLLGQQAQPSGGVRVRKHIRLRLRRLTQGRCRLGDVEAELRTRERDLRRIYHRRRSARPPASSSHETGVEEHAGKDVEYCGMEGVCNSEVLMLTNDASHTGELESIDRVVMHVDTVESGMLDSKIADPSAVEKKKPSEIPRKYWPPKNQGDIEFAERQAEKEYEESQFQPFQARGQYTYASKEEIARNAKKWMSEEAMVAFRRCIGSEDHLKELEYEFGELIHQCFSVEHYFKIFHHYNFTVKIRKHGSADWTLMTCFAEVKAILQTKHYVCYTLDPDENGRCYACQNQGMHELRHPSVDIFDCGKEDTTFPYYCEESDSDESHPIVGECESEDDLS